MSRFSLWTRALVVFAAGQVSALCAVQLLPGVHGFGLDRAINPAGFGPETKILHVTNLHDRGPGSLREAIAAKGPRVIVFDVSGVIELESDLKLNNPFCNIAGQTAPSPGIALHKRRFWIGADHVLVQHLRVRPGDDWATGLRTANRDALILAHRDGPGAVLSNVVIDHCTFSWSLDEVASAYHAYDNVTFYKCIFAEPLYASIHLDEQTMTDDLPKQAEKLADTALEGFSKIETASSPLAVAGEYQLAHSDSDGDFVEYSVPVIPAKTDRKNVHLVIAGITGPDRAKFTAEIRDAHGNLLKRSTDVFDQYGPTAELKTWIFDQDPNGLGRNGFTLPARETGLKVRLIVAGKNSASRGRKLGVDLVSLGDQHAMGPYLSSGTVGAGKCTFIGSILASLAGRGPWICSKQMVLANNVFYNRLHRFVMLGGSAWQQPSDRFSAAILNNTFIEGPSWLILHDSPISAAKPPAGSQLFADGNRYDAGAEMVSPPIVGARLAPFVVSENPVDYSDGLEGFVPQSAEESFAAVLATAGARPADRDAQEKRIIAEIAEAAKTSLRASRPGSLKNTVAEAGGWPVYESRTEVARPPKNPNADDASAGYPAGNGYTNLEEWLHERAAAVETANARKE